MPTIEISQKQARDLAAGKSISVASKTQLSIAVHKGGAVYVIEGDPRCCTAYTRIRGHAGRVPFGFRCEWAHNFSGGCYTVTEVSA